MENPQPTHQQDNKPFRILSWNIESGGNKLHGRKMENSHFKEILNQADILCLQETKGELESTDNFACLNNIRSGDKVGGKSGGVSIMFRKNMKKFVKRFYKGTHDIMAVIIKKELASKVR